ncbi:hypothetical protein CEXT_516841 [Caerostris extrusa]|uniref:Secreted protein n=1 Tax=Caerostris extrusa TaxID=172846 RepID=A0AAV4MQG1_CAEEX|nr:hypothetical protein CEXT_516841 [Caerostris extrusa]
MRVFVSVWVLYARWPDGGPGAAPSRRAAGNGNIRSGTSQGSTRTGDYNRRIRLRERNIKCANGEIDTTCIAKICIVPRC